MFRWRTNSLQIFWEKRFTREEHCNVCQRGEQETLQHFLLQCGGLDAIYRKYQILKTTIEIVLLFQEMNEEEKYEYTLAICNWKNFGNIEKRKITLTLNQSNHKLRTSALYCRCKDNSATTSVSVYNLSFYLSLYIISCHIIFPYIDSSV